MHPNVTVACHLHRQPRAGDLHVLSLFKIKVIEVFPMHRPCAVFQFPPVGIWEEEKASVKITEIVETVNRAEIFNSDRGVIQNRTHDGFQFGGFQSLSADKQDLPIRSDLFQNRVDNIF